MACLLFTLTLADSLLGMHFPASDIPAQAQRLYIINRIRLLYDRGAESARLVLFLSSTFQIAIQTNMDCRYAGIRRTLVSRWT